MLTNKHIAVIGGDARQLEVIKKLVELDARVSMVGFNQLEHGVIGANKCSLSEIVPQTIDAVIFPVHGMNIEGVIDSVFSNEKIKITKEFVNSTKETCLFFTGISNSYMEDLCNSNNRKLIKLMDRDDVAIYNSIPTAEGTILMVIQHTDTTIHGSKVAVLGPGRVGITVARSFAALGAKVKVGARKSEDIARIFEMGLEPFYMKNIQSEIQDVDICINTIPAMVLDADVISKMLPQSLIIDLASKPGGTNFRYAEKRGVKAMLAPGLPGIVAPKTAGKILAKVIVEILTKDK
ncbi:MAG: dpaA [Bacillales bacterium]|jgi:dipicolinate synthase subunit A|nr:dpaA [Bacillales bacterium]